MEKMNKFILGIGGLTVAALGIYAGLSNKEPAKYSLEWIKKLTDSDWAGLKPQGPAYHREHGFNLYKP